MYSLFREMCFPKLIFFFLDVFYLDWVDEWEPPTEMDPHGMERSTPPPKEKKLNK